MRTAIATTLTAAALIATLTGCSTGDDATPSVAPPSSIETPAVAGAAKLQVQGTGTATIHYTVNGGDEQTEENVTLPWEKEYGAVDELTSTVKGDGAGVTGCSITFGGDKLVAMENDPAKECTFAYFG
ncbi:MAG: hypothetical protein QM774_00580 [Gordonia sp. (in: high G+C Gram-positive bacteria)]|uniref:hypothetical protein n=1 Tax=Gordonia sp. (in: high G+C Gram-positive bacteria) TaxID=84139 RepID=UPI0039E5ABEA